jgi:hypothetical protein
MASASLLEGFQATAGRLRSERSGYQLARRSGEVVG